MGHLRDSSAPLLRRTLPLIATTSGYRTRQRFSALTHLTRTFCRLNFASSATFPTRIRSLVQRIASGDDHLRALVSDGDPLLELAAQVKDLHAAVWTMVAMCVGARQGSIIKWGQGSLPIVRN